MVCVVRGPAGAGGTYRALGTTEVMIYGTATVFGRGTRAINVLKGDIGAAKGDGGGAVGGDSVGHSSDAGGGDRLMLKLCCRR